MRRRSGDLLGHLERAPEVAAGAARDEADLGGRARAGRQHAVGHLGDRAVAAQRQDQPPAGGRLAPGDLGRVARPGRERAVELAEPVGERAADGAPSATRTDRRPERGLTMTRGRPESTNQQLLTDLRGARYPPRPMLAGIFLGLGASACWALANVAVARAGRDIGSFRALLWALVTGTGMAALASAAIDQRSAGALVPSLGGWIAARPRRRCSRTVCMFYAFEHGRLTVAVPIMSSWAVISAALSIAGVRTSASGARSSAGGAVVVAGALVVSRYAQAEGRARTRWRGAALASCRDRRRDRLRRADAG